MHRDGVSGGMAALISCGKFSAGSCEGKKPSGQKLEVF